MNESQNCLKRANVGVHVHVMNLMQDQIHALMYVCKSYFYRLHSNHSVLFIGLQTLAESKKDAPKRAFTQLAHEMHVMSGYSAH